MALDAWIIEQLKKKEKEENEADQRPVLQIDLYYEEEFEQEKRTPERELVDVLYL